MDNHARVIQIKEACGKNLVDNSDWLNISFTKEIRFNYSGTAGKIKSIKTYYLNGQKKELQTVQEYLYKGGILQKSVVLDIDKNVLLCQLYKYVPR